MHAPTTLPAQTSFVVTDAQLLALQQNGRLLVGVGSRKPAVDTVVNLRAGARVAAAKVTSHGHEAIWVKPFRFGS